MTSKPTNMQTVAQKHKKPKKTRQHEFKDREINKILGKGFKSFLVEPIGDLKEDTNRQMSSIQYSTQ